MFYYTHKPSTDSSGTLNCINFKPFPMKYSMSLLIMCGQASYLALNEDGEMMLAPQEG